jgi:regulator of protease activity HflC (stomatin/prohibitin superfamily)
MDLTLLASQLLPTLLASGGVTAAVKTIRFVKEGEKGVKLRFGKARRYKVGRRKGQVMVIEPGLRLLIPFLDTLVRRPVRQQTIRSDNQEIMLKDKTVFLVSAVTIFRVTDIYKALFEIDDLDGSIDDFCMAVLRDYLSLKMSDDIANTAQLAAEMLELLREKAAEWGVEFIAFRLTNCSPTNQTADLILISETTRRRTDAVVVADRLLGGLGINPMLAAAVVGVPVAAGISTRHQLPKLPQVNMTAVHVDGEEDDD